MLAAVTNALRVPEIRNRILFTAAILLLYRAGSWLPTPGVNTAEIQNLFNGEAGEHAVLGGQDQHVVLRSLFDDVRQRLG